MKKPNLIFIALLVAVTLLGFFIGKEPTNSITGMATAVPQQTVAEFGEYSIKPSFRVSMDNDFLTFYSDMERKANETRDSVISCLKLGSSINFDSDDVVTCAARGPYGGIVSTVKDLVGEYYIFFTFKQGATQVNFAMHVQDNIPPPKTQNQRITVDTSNKAYLEWDKNMASDTASYGVYYIAKGAPYLSLADFTSLVSGITQEKAEVTSLDYNNLDFLVVAKDDFGNFKFEK